MSQIQIQRSMVGVRSVLLRVRGLLNEHGWRPVVAPAGTVRLQRAVSLVEAVNQGARMYAEMTFSTHPDPSLAQDEIPLLIEDTCHELCRLIREICGLPTRHSSDLNLIEHFSASCAADHTAIKALVEIAIRGIPRFSSDFWRRSESRHLSPP